MCMSILFAGFVVVLYVVLVVSVCFSGCVALWFSLDAGYAIVCLCGGC